MNFIKILVLIRFLLMTKKEKRVFFGNEYLWKISNPFSTIYPRRLIVFRAIKETTVNIALQPLLKSEFERRKYSFGNLSWYKYSDYFSRFLYVAEWWFKKIYRKNPQNVVFLLFSENLTKIRVNGIKKDGFRENTDLHWEHVASNTILRKNDYVILYNPD